MTWQENANIVGRCQLCGGGCARRTRWDGMLLCPRCYAGARALAALVGRGSR